MKQLYTRWGKNLDRDHVLEEYPRPLLMREDYQILNGWWDYAFTIDYKQPQQYEGRILVPFSPETALSGVGRQLKPDEYLWYRRNFDLPGWDREKGQNRILLHFGAVDQSCEVRINGHKVKRHTGGYLPFEVDISRYAQESANELIVAVKDLSDTSYHSKGKQKLNAGGMFYTAQSGIWQTVWLEKVPETYIKEIKTVPDIEKKIIRIKVSSSYSTDKKNVDKLSRNLPIEIKIRKPGFYPDPVVKPSQISTEDMLETAVLAVSDKWIEIPIESISLWNCETPYLYYFEVKLGDDRAISYFAMRKFSLETKVHEEFLRICLNGEVQFQNGVLDQGYWPESLYTPPSDAAMIFDIQEMKKTGFNMVRKHLKIEPQRWYYHCDRLGIVVWQDMVNGGSYYKHWFVTYGATLLSWLRIPMRDVYPRLLSREAKAGRLEFIREMKETIRLLGNHPSIAAWVIFNEGWGQFQTEDMTRIVRRLDPNRLIDQASGWFDQGGGDFSSLHNYFFKLFIRPERERASVLSEFGGYSYREPGHCAKEKLYGYGICKNKKDLEKRFLERWSGVRNLIPQGLSASIYTQWTDVEEEVNGVFTYDREVRKIEPF
ncbi:glycoside hydrolase family 2 protein [Blautia obeum]|uniref:glycoside hydrolase family 2 protein n=1 Tax=Blautia obeum TaxID=40520 RepID=UPI001D062410|nr:sugar-binding domain-containing protein [Blautia obeum]MCB7342866.1 glycoside hydrolase family 2 [Blautia obeum]